jgi:LysR family transcriptional regulator, regulator for metE and metH
MLQMVACGRGVAALPAWLVEEYREKMGLVPVRLGRRGVPKHIYLGVRTSDRPIDFIKGFFELATTQTPKTAKPRAATRGVAKR